MSNYYIKTNRTFTNIRRYGWLFTILVAIGGLWAPKLGLLVILIMLSLMITSFFTGRYWCGNFCPHGSLFDKVTMPISLNKKIPEFFKSKYMIIGFFIFFMFSFSIRIVNALKLWGSHDFLDKLGFVFVTTYLMVLITGGLVAVFINPRTWCQFCPMGTIQKFTHKLGKISGITEKTEKKVTIDDKNKCLACGKCSRVCPFQLTPYLQFGEDSQFHDINCIKCGTCVENCPVNVLSLKTKEEALYLSKDGDNKYQIEI